jgi:hypothetical protein
MPTRRPIVSGATPIALQWSYNGLASRDSNPQIDVTIPATGRFGGVYVQAINKTGPHPNAAKLWMEHLYSDEGQLLWLKGYCNPIRYEDSSSGTRPGGPGAKLPDTTGAVFPTPAQLEAPPSSSPRAGTQPRCQDHRHAGSVVVLDDDRMAEMADQGAHAARPGRRRSWSWLGLIPFFVFAILFIGLPISYLVLGSFQGLDGTRPCRTTPSSRRRRSRMRSRRASRSAS